MVQTKLLPCQEARIEEEEFYHLALSHRDELSETIESIDDFFADGVVDEIKPKEYPSIWRDQFYDPFEGQYKEKYVQNNEEKSP